MIGFGIISLLVYIAIILVMNMVFKRKIAESMGVALLVLLVISGKNAPANLQAGVTFGTAARRSRLCHHHCQRLVRYGFRFPFRQCLRCGHHHPALDEKHWLVG